MELVREWYQNVFEFDFGLNEVYLGIVNMFLIERCFEEVKVFVEFLSGLVGGVGNKVVLIVGECVLEIGGLEVLFWWWKGWGMDLSVGMVFYVGCG